MNNLDDKLRDLLREPHHDSLGATIMSFPTQKTLDRIKQAFTEEGYVKVAKDNQGQIKTAQIFTIEHGTHELCSGQQWYDRFKAEILKEEVDAFQAAKRASGLEDK